MSNMIKKVNGVKDVLPSEVYKWHTVERVAARTAEVYGFGELRIPTFENTQLFVRSVGETTDVVQKEMFTVTGRDSSYTLRPEGTAGAMRAVLENGMLQSDPLPLKLFYTISCFRNERVQAGRLKEFHQFGAEMVGSASPAADAQMISLADNIIRRLGLKDIELHINSIGCPKCRNEYYKGLRTFFEPHKDELCDTCRERLEKNPMRLLDCKSEICREIGKDAPLAIDHLCSECAEHFEKLKGYLDKMGIKYIIDPKIVRGLDYYTRTVFEFITTSIGAQGTVCGGGRYDGLLEEMGGAPTPALGFAMGLERIIMTMENQGCEFMHTPSCDIYIGTMGDAAKERALILTESLRSEGYHAECDLMDRGVRAQMKYADKLGAAFSVIIGDNEINTGKAVLKNMMSGEQTELLIDDTFSEKFGDIHTAHMFELESLG